MKELKELRTKEVLKIKHSVKIKEDIMKTEKLRIKDLVTIGVFTVIYFVVMFISGMAGMIPILFFGKSCNSRNYNRYCNDAVYGEDSKPYAVFILGIIYAYCTCDGNTYIVLIHTIIIMVIAELLQKR